jgi:hypothetical protein
MYIIILLVMDDSFRRYSMYIIYDNLIQIEYKYIYNYVFCIISNILPTYKYIPTFLTYISIIYLYIHICTLVY